jgi:hypothetical protein
MDGYEVELGIEDAKLWFRISNVQQWEIAEAMREKKVSRAIAVLAGCLVRWENVRDESKELLEATTANMLAVLRGRDFIALVQQLEQAFQNPWAGAGAKMDLQDVTKGHTQALEARCAKEERELPNMRVVNDVQLCAIYGWPPSEVLNMPFQMRDAALALFNACPEIVQRGIM